MAVRGWSLLLHVLAGVLDFVFAFIAGLLLSILLLSFLLYLLLHQLQLSPVNIGLSNLIVAATLGCHLVVIIAYFTVLGRTGGTLFQRLFRLKKRTGATDRQIVQQF